MKKPTLHKTWFKPHQYIVQADKTYHIYYLRVSSNQQITINSKYIWDIQTGKASGPRYIVRSKKRIHLESFLKSQNPIFVLSDHPYRILQYINESDIIDISQESTIHQIPLFIGLQTLKEHFNIA